MELTHEWVGLRKPTKRVLGDWTSSPWKPWHMGILKDCSSARWKAYPVAETVRMHTASKRCSKPITALTRRELVITIPGNKKGCFNATRRQTQDFEKKITVWTWQPLHWSAIIGFSCQYSVTSRLSKKTFTFGFFLCSSCLVSSCIKSKNEQRTFTLLVRIAIGCLETRETSRHTVLVFF